MNLNNLYRLSLVLLICIISIGGCNNGGNSGGSDVPTSVPFNLNTALDLAILSLVAYNQRIECINGDTITVPEGYKLEEVIYQQIESALDSHCKNDTKEIPIAFIATKDKNIYLSFRGTATFSDAIADTVIKEEPFTFFNNDSANNAKVHMGFNTLYKSIREPIFDKIRTLSDEMKDGALKYNTLFVTGHSLGAALAVLAVPDLKEDIKNLPPVVMYNFAGPSVGNSEFVDIYTSAVNASWRVANTNDVIPKLPPTTLDCDDYRYEHAKSERDITFGKELPALPAVSCKQTGLIQGAIAIYLYDNQDQVETNHSMCTYHDTLCDELADSKDCKAQTDGLLGCPKSQ